MASHEFSSSAPETNFPHWRVEYEAALRETDRETLFKRIEVAEAAMLARRDVLDQGPDGFAERQETYPGPRQARKSKEGSLEVPVT